MAMFRALDNLRMGSDDIPRGAVFAGGRLSASARKVLLQKGRIAPVRAPPIKEVPQLKHAAEKLKAVGVLTPADVLEAESIEGIEEQELESLKRGAEESLAPPEPDRGCSGCS